MEKQNHAHSGSLSTVPAPRCGLPFALIYPVSPDHPSALLPPASAAQPSPDFPLSTASLVLLRCGNLRRCMGAVRRSVRPRVGNRRRVISVGLDGRTVVRVLLVSKPLALRLLLLFLEHPLNEPDEEDHVVCVVGVRVASRLPSDSLNTLTLLFQAVPPHTAFRDSPVGKSPLADGPSTGPREGRQVHSLKGPSPAGAERYSFSRKN
ncbi:hypothetical protein C8F01DRAFT_1134437 [Mycena amicta]|nr:hypothetical protein C8F01DRAFT_1134437 [Mycena amicta]